MKFILQCNIIIIIQYYTDLLVLISLESTDYFFQLPIIKTLLQLYYKKKN